MKTFSSSLHIRTKAVELLKEHDIDNFREIIIPYLISCLNQKITYQFADLKGLAGFTCHDLARDRYRMFLDTTTEESCHSRTSFTMAHELGHILLGHFSRGVNSSIFIGDPFLEVEANLFADEILMPTKPIIELRMGVREIIERYQVSVAAANNKMINLKKNSIYQECILKKNWPTPIRPIPSYKPPYDPLLSKVAALRDRWLDPDYEPLYY